MNEIIFKPKFVFSTLRVDYNGTNWIEKRDYSSHHLTDRDFICAYKLKDWLDGININKIIKYFNDNFAYKIDEETCYLYLYIDDSTFCLYPETENSIKVTSELVGAVKQTLTMNDYIVKNILE